MGSGILRKESKTTTKRTTPKKKSTAKEFFEKNKDKCIPISIEQYNAFNTGKNVKPDKRKPSPAKCLKCGSRFKHFWEIKKHLQTIKCSDTVPKLIAKEKTVNEKEDISEDLYEKCSCGKLVMKDTMKQHLDSSHKKGREVCLPCKTTIAIGKEGMNIHKKSYQHQIYSGEFLDEIFCSLCGMKFHSTKALAQHERLFHKNQNKVESSDRKSKLNFSNSDKLLGLVPPHPFEKTNNESLEVFKQRKSYLEFDGKSFNTREELESYALNENPNGYFCLGCNKILDSKRNWIYHVTKNSCLKVYVSSEEDFVEELKGYPIVPSSKSTLHRVLSCDLGDMIYCDVCYKDGKSMKFSATHDLKIHCIYNHGIFDDTYKLSHQDMVNEMNGFNFEDSRSLEIFHEHYKFCEKCCSWLSNYKHQSHLGVTCSIRAGWVTQILNAIRLWDGKMVQLNLNSGGETGMNYPQYVFEPKSLEIINADLEAVKFSHANKSGDSKIQLISESKDAVNKVEDGSGPKSGDFLIDGSHVNGEDVCSFTYKNVQNVGDVAKIINCCQVFDVICLNELNQSISMFESLSRNNGNYEYFGNSGDRAGILLRTNKLNVVEKYNIKNSMPPNFRNRITDITLELNGKKLLIVSIYAFATKSDILGNFSARDLEKIDFFKSLIKAIDGYAKEDHELLIAGDYNFINQEDDAMIKICEWKKHYDFPLAELWNEFSGKIGIMSLQHNFSQEKGMISVINKKNSRLLDRVYSSKYIKDRIFKFISQHNPKLSDHYDNFFYLYLGSDSNSFDVKDFSCHTDLNELKFLLQDSEIVMKDKAITIDDYEVYDALEPLGPEVIEGSSRDMLCDQLNEEILNPSFKLYSDELFSEANDNEKSRIPRDASFSSISNLSDQYIELNRNWKSLLEGITLKTKEDTTVNTELIVGSTLDNFDVDEDDIVDEELVGDLDLYNEMINNVDGYKIIRNIYFEDRAHEVDNAAYNFEQDQFNKSSFSKLTTRDTGQNLTNDTLSNERITTRSNVISTTRSNVNSTTRNYSYNNLSFSQSKFSPCFETNEDSDINEDDFVVGSSEGDIYYYDENINCEYDSDIECVYNKDLIEEDEEYENIGPVFEIY
ncbi:uncharacterized protein KGF55_003569 [Candida pseudojiufengensis]|uniref:uncharacterized protein n=1 Tax=Candida pseudojiufengensis TaxID=497109 RepID=UPI00222577CA|nr:uncharacterized protein KGF55_003569 [Candida pseudojiufengensis]KAI5962493.1 hypothetical protein KGF55_003569 [Candida pseudojiufengensis]